MSTKEKIIRAAGELFLTKGYSGTSTDQIVLKAEVAKGSFFYNFKNKNHLGRIVVRSFYEKQIKLCLVNSLSQPLSNKEKIIHFLKGVNADLKKAKYVGGCLLANFSIELSDADNEIRKEMESIYDDWRNLLKPVIKEATSKNNKECEDLVEFIITSVQGITLTSKVHKNQERVDRDFNFLIKTLKSQLDS